jgi:hypothetical protein
MRLECKSLEPGPLSEKGVGGIIDCRITDSSTPVKHLSDAYGVVELALRALGVSTRPVFTENENIGDSHMLYKFHVIEEGVSLASIRLVTHNERPIRLVITIDKLAISMMGGRDK